LRFRGRGAGDELLWGVWDGRTSRSVVMVVDAGSVIVFSDTWCRSREIHRVHGVSQKLTMVIGRVRGSVRRPHKG
jgi:hypothetical protein